MKLIRRIALFVLGAIILLYGGDFLLAESQGNKGLGSVDVQIMWAIKQKNGRIDYELGDTETRACVHSLFPHSGYLPCWYLTSHKQQTITVGGGVAPGFSSPQDLVGRTPWSARDALVPLFSRRISPGSALLCGAGLQPGTGEPCSPGSA